VWEALLDDMPMTALIRNLATMTRVGVLEPGSAGTSKAVEQLGDVERVRRARVHPIAVLAALRTYSSATAPVVAGRATYTRPSATRLSPRVGRRRAAGRGRHGLERLLDRRPERPGDARRRGLRTPRRCS